MGREMGMGRLGTADVCIMRKFRWMFFVDGVSGDGTNALPPDKGARPSLNFKEAEVQHLNETVYFPMKPDWKPITLTLFDLKGSGNPVFDWLSLQYDVCGGDNPGSNFASWRRPGNFKKNAWLEMYDGCGNIVEKWWFQNVWPNNIEWGDLDMQSGDYVTAELTLRYDRAWVTDCYGRPDPSFSGDISPGSGMG
jgi:hypothetical protein